MPQPIFSPPKMQLIFDPEGDPTRPWVTAREDRFFLPAEGLISIVPAGFRTDLTSYPRWILKVLLVLWPLAIWFAWVPWVIGIVATVGLLVMDPYGRQQRAALHHDKGYFEGGIRFAKDSIYLVIMAVDGVVTWRRLLNYWGVRCFGWVHFGRTRRAPTRRAASVSDRRKNQ